MTSKQRKKSMALVRRMNDTGDNPTLKTRLNETFNFEIKLQEIILTITLN